MDHRDGMTDKTV